MPEKAPIFFIGLIFTAIAVLPFAVPRVVLPSVPPLHFGDVGEEFQESTILFVGDVMLGRHVETLADMYGNRYPFGNTTELLTSANVTIGNFEAAVPEVHTHTPDNEYVFSVDGRFMQTLSDVGFDILSLANNHSFDASEKGYFHTHRACAKHDLVCTGHPTDLGFSKLIFIVGETKVGLVSLYGHTIDGTATSTIEALLAPLRQQTDVQLVFVHWGIEYERTHSQAQEQLAHQLINAGAEAVIGHHPHVVQDVERYNNKLIFYSLGNFVFDQYFSEEVAIGAALRVTITKQDIAYELVPVESLTKKSQPAVLQGAKAKQLFERVLYDVPYEQVGDVARVNGARI